MVSYSLIINTWDLALLERYLSQRIQCSVGLPGTPAEESLGVRLTLETQILSNTTILVQI